MANSKNSLDPEALRLFGAQVDFGNTATDYATHRAGFPQAFFDLLHKRGWVQASQKAIDLGCGTGTVARGLAQLGLDVTGVDPAQNLLTAARALNAKDGATVHYVNAYAETTGLPGFAYHLVTAGQCWHWFDRPRAATEARRLLTYGGRIIIAHFDWLPQPGSVVEITEKLILRHNPDWVGAGGTGIYPNWLQDLANAGFDQIETASFDVIQPYSHAAWRGRIRASAGIAASLSEEQTRDFDAQLAQTVSDHFPDTPLLVPHRVWLVTGCRSKNHPAPQSQ